MVCVSLHSSLDAKKHLELGSALESLREEGVLILGSGFTFHNMNAFFNPSAKSKQASTDFNDWLKGAILNDDDREKSLLNWEKAPGARTCHPREEHLVPLFSVAGAGGKGSKAELMFERRASTSDHAFTAYLFD